MGKRLNDKTIAGIMDAIKNNVPNARIMLDFDVEATSIKRVKNLMHFIKTRDIDGMTRAIENSTLTRTLCEYGKKAIAQAVEDEKAMEKIGDAAQEYLQEVMFEAEKPDEILLAIKDLVRSNWAIATQLQKLNEKL